jgi:hypothetical protein
MASKKGHLTSIVETRLKCPQFRDHRATLARLTPQQRARFERDIMEVGDGRMGLKRFARLYDQDAFFVEFLKTGNNLQAFKRETLALIRRAQFQPA